MIRRPPRSTQSRSSAASDVYKRQPLGSTTRAHHFFCLAEFRDPFSRRCDHFSHHHLFRALRATDRFIFPADSSGYSLDVHGVRSLTLRTRHPSPDHSLYPYPHTDHLCPIFHPSRCPFALRIYQPLASPLELAGGPRRGLMESPSILNPSIRGSSIQPLRGRQSINPSIRQSGGHQSSRSEAINPSIRQSVNPINPRRGTRQCPHARSSGERRRQHRGYWKYWGVARS